jgi:hypothetical protein
MASRRRHAAASATATFALIAGAIAAVSTPAHAAPSLEACAPAYPLTQTVNGNVVSNLTPGQKVTGLTSVDSGAPVQFTGTYVGTLDNGIADGMDMLVFDLQGPRITKADGTVDAGNWSGISGSPVYDDATGALIGSVSYGFTSALSPRAGVTPATYIYDLSAPGYSASAQAPATVKASRTEAAAIARASSNPAPLGTGHVLQPAKQISGVNADVANRFAKKSRLLQSKSPALAGGFRAGNGGGGSDVDYPVVPGGSIAMTSSTGTITTGLIGTVTAVCGNQVFAFGHPGNFTGASTATFNGAQTVTIQEDGIMSPSFKVANIGRVKGVINQDRLQGIVGTLGQVPTTAATVTTTTTAPRLAAPRTSSTLVSEQQALPFTVASQVATDALTALNQYSTGEATMSWTISYTRAGSRGVKTFKRVQRYSAAADFPDAVAYDAASDVETLLTNGFEKVTISQVAIASSLQPAYRAVKPARAQFYSKGKWRWVARGGIKAKRGSTIPVRLRVIAADADSTARPAFTSQTKLKISKNARGTGKLVFDGQAFSSFDDDDVFADEDALAELFGEETDPDDEPAEPRNLTELVAMLAAQPRQDDIVGTLSYKTKRGKIETQRTVRGPSVAKGSLKVRLTFKK